MSRLRLGKGGKGSKVEELMESTAEDMWNLVD